MTKITDSVESPALPRPDQQQSRRAVVSGALGSALEWFDFAVYGALSATLFPTLFFNDLGETGGLLASFATFGVGFVARPLGGIVFGHLGDRIGRRPVLLATFIIMGVASTLIGLLPTGQGAAIAAVLVGLRFIQGFSLGGEATGSQLMTMEHAAQHRRGLFGALINMGSPLANLLANLSLVVLSSTLAADQWESWGWRVPFLMSLLLVAVGVYIRVRLEETPAFERAQQEEVQHATGLRVLREQPGRIVKLVLVFGGIAMTYNLLITYGLSYMTQHGNEGSSSFLALAIANFVAFMACIAGGHVSDRVGRKPVFVIGALGCLVGSLAFFPVAATGSFVGSVAALVVAASGVQFAFGAQPAMWAEQFPTPTRFAGSALSYTISNVIFAAPAPFLATALAAASGGSTMPVVVLLVIALGITIVTVLTMPERRHIDLTTYTSEDAA